MNESYVEINDNKVRCINYSISQELCVVGGMALLPPGYWQPCNDNNIDLYDRMPYGLDSLYKYSFKQSFQPSVFFKNCSALSNYYKSSHDDKALKCSIEVMMNELVDGLNEYLMHCKSGCFVINKFEFHQNIGVNIPTNWVGGLSNAFVILGLVCVSNVFSNRSISNTILNLCAPYSEPYCVGKNVPDYWISCIDANGYIIYEEYPEPGGKFNFVLNGHIFAIHALYEAFKITKSMMLLDLVKAGITTVKNYIKYFRRKNKVNLYSLYGARKSDYLPERTIRQQCELYALTGDVYFKNMARTFYGDFSVEHNINLDACGRHCNYFK